VDTSTQTKTWDGLMAGNDDAYAELLASFASTLAGALLGRW